jgi:hypothetical protein
MVLLFSSQRHCERIIGSGIGNKGISSQDLCKSPHHLLMPPDARLISPLEKRSTELSPNLSFNLVNLDKPNLLLLDRSKP